MPSAATRNILLYSPRVLLYSTRVRLYGVGGMWWEQVVVRKVSRGSPMTVLLAKEAANSVNITSVNLKAYFIGFFIGSVVLKNILK